MSNEIKQGDKFTMAVTALNAGFSCYRDCTEETVYTAKNTGEQVWLGEPTSVLFADDSGDDVITKQDHCVKVTADE